MHLIENHAKRVIVINGKFIIPGQATELQSGDVSHPYLQSCIERGELVVIHGEESINQENVNQENESHNINKMTIPELKQFAADNGINLGEATRKEEFLAVIAAVIE